MARNHVSVNGNPRRTIPDDLQFADWRARDGWTLRSFSRPQRGESRGSLLFLGGRADFVEKHLEAFDHWTGRGWRVDGFDWRGQGGSGRLAADASVCHLDSFEPLVDDLEDFVGEWRRHSPSPHVAVAHSMGAHLLLRALAERRVSLDAAALLAPMLGLPRGPLPPGTLTLIAETAVAAGFARRPLWRRDPGNHSGRLTSCPDRHEDKLWWKRTKPQISAGPPSWGWLRSALRSIRQLDRSFPTVAVPLLFLASRKDIVIDVGALSRFAARLPAAELHFLPEAGHELLREADHVRLPVFEHVDEFLERRTSSSLRSTPIDDTASTDRGVHH